MTSAIRPPQGVVTRASARALPEGLPDSAERETLLFAMPVVAGIMVGMSLGITPLVWFSALAALALALVVPYAGLAVLAFMATLVGPPGFPAPGFTLVLAAATLFGCVYRLPIDRPAIRISLPVAMLGAFVLFATVQQLPEMLTGYSGTADHAVGYLYMQLLAGLGTFVAAIWVLGGRSPYPILAMAIAGAVTGALIAILPHMVPGLAGWFAPLKVPSDDLVRAVGTFSNPNFMGGSSALSMTVALSLMATADSRRVRIVLLACALVLAAAVLLSLSRGALLTALVGLGFAFVRGRRSAVAIVLLGLIGAIVVYPLFLEWRLMSLNGIVSVAAYEATSQSDSSRLGGALAGLALFASSPIVGVGFGHYLAAAGELPGTVVATAAHNWYTYTLGEEGLVGATLWTLFAVTLIARVRTLPGRPRTVGIALTAAFLTACLFLEVPTSFQAFAMPAVVFGAVLAADWSPARERGRLATMASNEGSLATAPSHV